MVYPPVWWCTSWESQLPRTTNIPFKNVRNTQRLCLLRIVNSNTRPLFAVVITCFSLTDTFGPAFPMFGLLYANSETPNFNIQYSYDPPLNPIHKMLNAYEPHVVNPHKSASSHLGIIEGYLVTQHPTNSSIHTYLSITGSNVCKKS